MGHTDNSESERPLTVMFSFAEPDTQANPFTLSLSHAAERFASVRHFSWRQALTTHLDVFHIHWPELMVRAPRSWTRPIKTVVRELFLWKCRRTGTAIVCTTHNLTPHEQLSAADARALKRLERNVHLWIHLNRHTPSPTDAPSLVIPHGHYRDSYEHTPLPRSEGILYFGLIRPYKGVERLLAAYRETSADLPLRVLGKPATEQLADEISTIRGSDPRIRLDLRFASSAELSTAIRQSRLVVLPYRSMHNSGAALLALSLNTPVLVPRNSVTEDLQEEFGKRHVHLFEGELSPQDLQRAARSVSTLTDEEFAEVDMTRREWDQLGAMHHDAYLHAIAEARR